MKNIKLVLKERLNEKYTLNESFKNISLTENEDERFNLTVEQLGSLIDDGYSDDEINDVINEQMDWLKNFFGGNKPTNQVATTQNNIISTGIEGGFAEFKEFFIRKFLNILGFEGPLSNAIATAIGNMTMTDLISVFRGQQSCLQNGDVVAGALLNALTSYIIETGIKQDSLIANYFRNTLFVYLKNEGYTKSMGRFMCKAIDKFKGSIIPSFTK